MNKEEILVLAKAGFTAQQIAALNTVGVAAPAPAPAPAQATVTATPPAQATVTATPPAQATVTAPALPQGATIDDVLASVQGLTQVVQSNALLNTQQPKPVTAEDILAEIINPPTTPKGGNN